MRREAWGTGKDSGGATATLSDRVAAIVEIEQAQERHGAAVGVRQ